MTIISKASLAAELGVSKSRISQYLRSGLPARADGKLDRDAALNWIGLNLRSGADRKKGPARARELSPDANPPTRFLGDAEAARRAASEILHEVPYIVMSVATDVDLPMKVIFALVMSVHEALGEVKSEHLANYDRGLLPRRPAGTDALSIDWADVAQSRDEAVDLDAWEAYRAAIFEPAC